MDDKFQLLRRKVIELSSNPNFIHNKWFVKWHLEIVEQISLELCGIYPKADKYLVLGMVWIHDYAKIIDFDNEHDPQTFRNAILFLQSLGFEDMFINKLIEYIDIFESKMTTDLNQAPIEVKIVSSADAASHMVGPFFSLFWYEHPENSVEQLLEANNKKLARDWDRKIVLPEVRKAFKDRYQLLLELSGNLPDSYL